MHAAEYSRHYAYQLACPCVRPTCHAFAASYVALCCAVLCCAVLWSLHRYKKAADWELLSGLVQDNPTLPIIGNGDILTHYEAADRYGVPLHSPSRRPLKAGLKTAPVWTHP